MDTSRRDFFKRSLALVGLGLLIPTIFSRVGQAEERRRSRGGEGAAGSGNLPLVKPGVGMAAGVNYVEKHSDLKNAALKTDRQGVKFEKQFCTGCILYTKHSGSGASEIGKCQLFPGQGVKGEGWCTSWAKKA